MNRIRALAWALAASSALFSVAASAKPESYVVDPSHSRILFWVSHFGYSMLPGMFRNFDVELLYDHDEPENSSLSVNIEAASVDMFHERLNNHLKADDFFDAEAHPTLTFVSTKVEASDEGSARVTGDLTLLGETRPVTFDVALVKYAPHPMSGRQAVGFEASGALDRTDFGMSYRAPFVGENVRFTITVEARRAQ